MPEMNGLEASSEIRKIETTKKTPIIAVTAGVTDINREKCFSSGMDDFTSKPVTKMKLENLVQKWFVKKKQHSVNHYIANLIQLFYIK